MLVVMIKIICARWCDLDKKMTVPGGGRNGLRSGDILWISPGCLKGVVAPFVGTYLFLLLVASTAVFWEKIYGNIPRERRLKL